MRARVRWDAIWDFIRAVPNVRIALVSLSALSSSTYAQSIDERLAEIRAQAARDVFTPSHEQEALLSGLLVPQWLLQNQLDPDSAHISNALETFADIDAVDLFAPRVISLDFETLLTGYQTLGMQKVWGRCWVAEEWTVTAFLWAAPGWNSIDPLPFNLARSLVATWPGGCALINHGNRHMQGRYAATAPATAAKNYRGGSGPDAACELAAKPELHGIPRCEVRGAEFSVRDWTLPPQRKSVYVQQTILTQDGAEQATPLEMTLNGLDRTVSAPFFRAPTAKALDFPIEAELCLDNGPVLSHTRFHSATLVSGMNFCEAYTEATRSVELSAWDVAEREARVDLWLQRVSASDSRYAELKLLAEEGERELQRSGDHPLAAQRVLQSLVKLAAIVDNKDLISRCFDRYYAILSDDPDRVWAQYALNDFVRMLRRWGHQAQIEPVYRTSIRRWASLAEPREIFEVAEQLQRNFCIWDAYWYLEALATGPQTSAETRAAAFLEARDVAARFVELETNGLISLETLWGRLPEPKAVYFAQLRESLQRTIWPQFRLLLESQLAEGPEIAAHEILFEEIWSRLP